jgi:hypothetical protein
MEKFSFENTIFLVVWILFQVLIVSVIVMFLVINNKAKKLAEAHSKRLAGIKNINQKYRFDNSIKSRYDYHVFLPNKRSFDSFDPSSYFGGLVISDVSSYESLFQNLEMNYQQYQRYFNELSFLPTEIPKEICKKHTHIPFFLINKNEKKLIKKTVLTPVTDSKVVFHVKYTSPKGRNSYSKEYVCMMSQLSSNYYHHVVTQSMKDFQRSLMTDSLRYDVMKRDGFRCVLCGRTANDGVKLHVDHILPVAKGGKTEKNNLRTLCEFCNLGKSAKYDPNGLN